MKRKSHLLVLGTVMAVAAPAVPAAEITVTIENLAPTNGTWLTPLWVGFHNGGFDIYDLGSPASMGLERLAEDGDTSVIAGEFLASGAGFNEGTLDDLGPIAPGVSVSATFDLDGTLEANRFFSYASMVIPSNDAFIANGNPLAFPIFDAGGNFLTVDFIVLGSMVNDAGTEVNDEIPENTAFFGQKIPDTGVDENGVVHLHPGFLPVGSGGILDDPMFMNADFLMPGYEIARITVVPEPAGIAMLMLGAALTAVRLRRSSGVR